MSVNKYTRRKKNNSGDYEILGIVLIIISAFLLVCTLIPIIFGVVSEGLRSVLLGLFGIFAYIALCGMLATGICLVMGRRIAVGGKYIALIVGIVISFFLILQLATTSAFFEKNFGEYLGEVYSAKFTAGGLIFGIIAYAFQAFLPLPVAYVLFSLIFIACGGLLGYFIYKEVRYTHKPDELPAEEDDSFGKRAFTDDVPAQKVYMHTPTKLFVEDIVPAKKEEPTEEIGISDPEYHRMDQSLADSMLYDRTAGSDKKMSEFDEQVFRSQAGASLYDNSVYAPTKPNVRPEVVQASVDEVRPKRPDKILHESGKMPFIVIPTQKESDSIYNPNKIINTDEAVRGGIIDNARTDYGKSTGNQSVNGFGIFNNTNSGVGQMPASGTGFGVDSAHGSYIKDERVSDTPIINAEYFERMFADKQPREPEPRMQRPTESSKPTPPPAQTLGSFSDYPDRTEPTRKPEIEKSEPIREQIRPIINSSFVSNEMPKEKPAEKSRRAFYEENDFDDIDDTASDPLASVLADKSNDITSSVEPESRHSSSLSDSFVLDENVVDLSEKHNDYSNNDNSGYYTVEEDIVPPKQERPERNRKAKVLDGQLDIDSVHNPDSDLIEIPQAQAPYSYSYPPISLLSEPDRSYVIDTNDIEAKSHDIEEALRSLKFPAKVVNVVSGPTVTRYELQPQSGISVKKILALDKDLEFHLARGAVRIEAPVANKQAIGIEVANNAPSVVGFREIIESGAFSDTKSVLPLALGKDIGGDAIVRSLEKMPHLLIAGTTGTGKSVCLNTLILSLVYKRSPEEVRLILVDPKQVEFTLYRELPHLLLRNPITDVNHAISALEWLIDEMNRRYTIFGKLASKGYPVRNIAEYNACSLVKEGKAMKIPYIVMIVDELADLMSMRKKDVENGVRQLLQKSRASGIHLVLATQRPSVDVITGTIKVNLPTRISFKVTSNADSRTILDQGGAEALLGRGDMLIMDNSEPIRLQGAFVSNEEIVGVVDYVKRNNEACFDENIEKAILVSKEPAADASVSSGEGEEESADEKLFPDIMRCLINNGTASTSLLQRRFSLGYSRASRIIDVFEMRKWVGPSAGAKPREVYMTQTQYEEVFNQSFDD